MIKIIDDWYITVEENPTNYVVRRGNGEKDKKQGWKDKPLGYFGSLREAVKFIREEMVAKNLLMACYTLSEAIQTISEVDYCFEGILLNIEA